MPRTYTRTYTKFKSESGKKGILMKITARPDYVKVVDCQYKTNPLLVLEVGNEVIYLEKKRKISQLFKFINLDSSFYKKWKEEIGDSIACFQINQAIKKIKVPLRFKCFLEDDRYFCDSVSLPPQKWTKMNI